MSHSLHLTHYADDSQDDALLTATVRVASDGVAVVWVGSSQASWSIGLSLEAAMTLGERLVAAVTAYEDSIDTLEGPGLSVVP